MRGETYRSEHVGSLLRPAAVFEAREKFAEGRIDADELTAVEDGAILDALRRQKECGVQVFSDGEFRRAGFMTSFIDAVDGFEDKPMALPWKGGIAAPPSPNMRLVVGELKPKPDKKLSAREASFMIKHSPGPFKITVPSAGNFGVLSWRKGLSAYPSQSDLLAHAAGIMAEGVGALVNEGAPYIQIDTPIYTHWCDDKIVAKYREVGMHDLDRLLQECINADNKVLDQARAAGAVTGVHLCRGNSMGRWLAEGGYDRLADKVFNDLRCNRLLLEYDSPRAGTFEPLRFVPPDKTVVLGLVTTKSGQLEDRGSILRQIEQASQYIPVARLALSPQCGFASSGLGNPITEDEQWRKLAFVRSIAQEVWGNSAAERIA